MTAQQRRKPRDPEEAAAFKGMGQAITAIRERRGMDREELAAKLWEELNSLLAGAVPHGASEKQAEDAILFAIMGSDTEIRDLYERVRRLARDRPGYLCKRLEEPGPVARVRRRLYGRWA